MSVALLPEVPVSRGVHVCRPASGILRPRKSLWLPDCDSRRGQGPLDAKHLARREAGGGPGVSPGLGAAGSIFEGRLQRDSATQISLQPYKGRFVGVNGELVDIVSGFTRTSLDNLINGAGADTGASPAVGTLFYCYVSNSKATFSPLSIRLSLTVPSLVSGVYYLSGAGNAANWRFVGWVLTISNAGAANFVDKKGTGAADTPQRFVVNYYNRILAGMLCCPNYVNDNAVNFYTAGPAVGAGWGPIAAADFNAEFISNGEDVVHFTMFACLRTLSATYFGVGESSTTLPSTQVICVTANQPIAVGSDYNPPSGYQFLCMMCINFTVQATVYADLGRNGGGVDEYSTYLTGSVFI